MLAWEAAAPEPATAVFAANCVAAAVAVSAAAVCAAFPLATSLAAAAVFAVISAAVFAAVIPALACSTAVKASLAVFTPSSILVKLSHALPRDTTASIVLNILLVNNLNLSAKFISPQSASPISATVSANVCIALVQVLTLE